MGQLLDQFVPFVQVFLVLVQFKFKLSDSSKFYLSVLPHISLFLFPFSYKLLLLSFHHQLSLGLSVELLFKGGNLSLQFLFLGLKLDLLLSYFKLGSLKLRLHCLKYLWLFSKFVGDFGQFLFHFLQFLWHVVALVGQNSEPFCRFVAVTGPLKLLIAPPLYSALQLPNFLFHLFKPLFIVIDSGLVVSWFVFKLV